MTTLTAFAPFVAAVSSPVAGASTLDMARALAPAGIALDVLVALGVVVMVLARDRRPPASLPRTRPGLGALLAARRMLPRTLGALLALRWAEPRRVRKAIPTTSSATG
jgi:hypothetical protein